MPRGSYMRDAVPTDLVVGATLNAAGSTNSTIQTASWPLEATVELRTGTVTGTTPTLTVTVQSSSTSDFSSDVVTHGTILLTGGSQSNVSRYIDLYAIRKFMRSTVVLGGTSPVYTGTTIRLVPSNVARDAARTA